MVTLNTLVIQTQYKENYGDEASPYWKFKGGSTYFVNDLTEAQVARIEEDGIPFLTTLIEYSNGMSEEYILDYQVRQLGKGGDGKGPICDHWETPIQFRWGGDRWLAQTNHTPRDEDNFWRRGIVSKAEQWIPLAGAERSDYHCQYKVANGWFDAKDPQLKVELEGEVA
jgi:hypothetical protein|tara:strand:+ start:861 stop:1367 length:507 start_codon:yes stop_codon:yes gene_type:complete